MLPETILDTSSNSDTRLFLYQFFRIRTVVSLPYDTFRPFTSTKTCILLAEKRSRVEAKLWKDAWAKIVHSKPGANKREVFLEVIDKVGWSDNPIFMAEPASVGYKRRKGLPDLQLKNELYLESPDGTLDTDATVRTVLSSYFADSALRPSARLGFWTDLWRIEMRDHLRLDPKYRWLWDYQEGVAHGDPDASQPLRSILQVIGLPKVKKGELDAKRILIDLEYVESRQGYIHKDAPLVDMIGAQKVLFAGSVVAWIGAEMKFARSQAVASGDAFEHRPPECGHCVQNFLADLDLRDLPGEAARFELGADHALPTTDLRFYPAALVVPCGHLPGHAAVAADLGNMAIPNGWIPRRLRSDHCVFRRRYNHIQGLPIPLPQHIPYRRSIIGAVSQKARDRSIELIQEPG